MENNTNEQLLQLVTATWDGNLISKADRDWLVTNGYAEQQSGYNFLTAKGIKEVVNLGLLRP